MLLARPTAKGHQGINLPRYQDTDIGAVTEKKLADRGGHGMSPTVILHVQPGGGFHVRAVPIELPLVEEGRLSTG
jgi:hypothetical protein